MATEVEAGQAEHEVAGFNFGAISAGRPARFSVAGNLAGKDGHTPSTALIVYAVVRNATAVVIEVLGEGGNHVLEAGEKKVCAYPNGAQLVEVLNTDGAVNIAGTRADGVFADIGIVGCCARRVA